MKHPALFLLSGAALLAMPSPGLAQARDTQMLSHFEKCGSLSNDAERLACFDAALASAPALAQGLRAEEKERRRDDFGLAAADLKARDRPAKKAKDAEPTEDAEPEEITGTLSEVYTDSRSRRAFLLANGQLWQEQPNSTYRGIIRPGWTVTIAKGGIGGYRLTFEGRTGYFAVRRMR